MWSVQAYSPLKFQYQEPVDGIFIRIRPHREHSPFAVK